MVSKNSLSNHQNQPYEQPPLPFDQNLTGLPDFIANDEQALADVQRGMARANQDLAHPELQQLPLPRHLPTGAERIAAAREQAAQNANSLTSFKSVNKHHLTALRDKIVEARRDNLRAEG